VLAVKLDVAEAVEDAVKLAEAVTVGEGEANTGKLPMHEEVVYQKCC
jgi:hypothetical protein